MAKGTGTTIKYRGWTIHEPYMAVRLDGETSEEFVRRQALCALWDLDTRCGYGTSVVLIARYVQRLERDLAEAMRGLVDAESDSAYPED